MKVRQLLIYTIAKCLVLILLSSLAGCNVLSGSGPATGSIVNSADNVLGIKSQIQYELIEASVALIPDSQTNYAEQFSTRLTAQRLSKRGRLVVAGDELVIRIWEAEAGGLFASNGPGETEFSLAVSNSGEIQVPHAGRIYVAEQSAIQIRKLLLDRFAGKAIDPEISIQIKDSNYQRVPVLGAVGKPGLVKIPARGIKILELIAMVGGTKHPSWETDVAITRGGLTEEIRLASILSNPKNNVIILQEDTVSVTYKPRRFAVYGAVQKNALISLDTARPTLSELLANAGGLVDSRAAANAIFVYRSSGVSNTKGSRKSVIYRFRLNEPDSFFLLSAFELHADDIIYVSNAKSFEISKFLSSFVSPTLGAVKSVSVLN